jgi:hypothetical protein
MYRDRQQAVGLRELARTQRRQAANQRAYAADVRRSNGDRLKPIRPAEPTPSADSGPWRGSRSVDAGPDAPTASARHTRPGRGPVEDRRWPKFVVSPSAGQYARRASEARQRAQDAGARARIADAIARDAHERALVAVRRSMPNAGLS